MTKGPRRLVLDQYLDSATEGFVKNAGQDWKDKAGDLNTLADALEKAAQQAELRIGEQTLTGPAIRAGMEKASASLITKAEQLRTAGEALRQVGQQIADTRETRDSMKDLGTKPAAYQPPPGTPGVEPTPEELQAQADASAARQAERTSWQSAYDKQEARSLALTKEMDAAFLAAIPPMKEIHGQDDPTEPSPTVPSGPQGPYLPGTQGPPVTGGGNGGGNGGDNHYAIGTLVSVGNPSDTTTTTPTTTTPTTTPTTTTTPPPITTPVHTEPPSTTVLGSSQNGVTYQPSGAEGLAPSPGSGAGGASAAASAAAFGAAGGAGGLAAGAVRPGVAPTSPTRGASAVKPIGSTGRAAGAGSLSRPSASSPGARGAGAPAARGASSAGSAGGRGSAGARGGAGAAGARGTSTSSSGARGGAGAGGAGGRGGRRGERDRVTERDSLVYDQDWLSDDDVAPGVLD